MAEKYLHMPIVVIINGGSASASEIVTAALRENKRAIVLGEHSFGKACVQTIIPLPDGSALRLTTAKYYTPLGHSIHLVGIKPDIVVADIKVKEKKADIFETIKEGLPAEKPKLKFDYKKDYQILRALDLIKGLLVLSPTGT